MEKINLNRALASCVSFENTEHILLTKDIIGLGAIQAPHVQAVIWPAQYQDFPMKQYLEDFLNSDEGNIGDARIELSRLFNKDTSYRFSFSKPLKRLFKEKSALDLYDKDLDKAFYNLVKMQSQSTNMRLRDLGVWLKTSHLRSDFDESLIFTDENYDTSFKMHTDTRQLYSLVKNSKYSGTEFIIDDLSNADRQAVLKTPLCEQASIRADYRVGQIGANDIMVFAGDNVSELGLDKKPLIHGAPIPKVGEIRRSVFIDLGRYLGERYDGLDY